MYQGVLAAAVMVVTLLLGAIAHGAELTIPQGGVGRVEVAIQAGDSAPWGSVRGERVLFFPLGGLNYAGLVGVDMESALGRFTLEVKVLRHGAAVVLTTAQVVVEAGKFGVQHLTLPDKMVDLDPPTLKRVSREKKEVGTLWRSGANTAFFTGRWRMPVDGEPSGSFGKRRFINDQPRNPHNGEDLAAPTGTPVLAPNGGVVRLARARYFGGNTVFLEHGAGLFTFYMHLSEVSVTDGQRVKGGDLIGKVGASGRATGPHLHWGGRLNNARINPLELVRSERRLSLVP